MAAVIPTQLAGPLQAVSQLRVPRRRSQRAAGSRQVAHQPAFFFRAPEIRFQAANLASLFLAGE
jgi:hypothetical protein